MNIRALRGYKGLELVNYMNAEFVNMYAVVKDGETLFTDSNESHAYRVYDREFDKLIEELKEAGAI
ncbi:hypothetical protein [Paenibacillus polymyxa]|nr:hypothetical protein [Paenibacillus polymyxa]MDN4090908.1 hypothetical protein [Paenibacillus polymyxa]